MPESGGGGGGGGEGRRIWGMQSVVRFGPVDEDMQEKMREAYIETLLALIRHVQEGKPLLRVMEWSVYRKPEDDEAVVRMQGFETDEDYDRLVQRRRERGLE